MSKEEMQEPGSILTSDEKEIIEKKQCMENEEMFTREWWKEKFKHAKSIGYGAKALRDEDKLWFAGPVNYRWLRLVVEAIVEKYGDEAKKIIQKVIQEDGKQMGEFFLDMLGIEERDAVAFAAVMASADAAWGHNVGLTDVAPDRSRARSICSWCGLAASGSVTKEFCEIIGNPYGVGVLEAIDPTLKKIRLNSYIGPPCVVEARAVEEKS